jgi:hypothetical protein
LLIGPNNNYYLAHLKVEAPVEVSPNKKLHPLVYWPTLFCTHKLNGQVVYQHDREKIEKTIEHFKFKSTLKFSCVQWYIAEQQAREILNKIQAEKKNNFFLLGKQMSHFFQGNGANCKDWANELLKPMTQHMQETPVKLESLLDIIKEKENSLAAHASQI